MKKIIRTKGGAFKTAVAAIAIASLFVISMPFIFSNGGQEEDQTLGAIPSTVDISSMTDEAGIESAIAAALGGHSTVTVIGTNLNIGSVGDTTPINIEIPEGKTVNWNAKCEPLWGGICVKGAGSFISSANSISAIGGIWMYDTATVTLNGNVTFKGDSWGSGAYGTGNTMIINGNLTITGEYHSFCSKGSSTVIINGDLTITGEGSDVAAGDDSELIVKGSVNGTVYADDYACIVIVGNLDFKSVFLNDTQFSEEEYDMEVEGEYAGYRLYTHGGASIYVKGDTGGGNGNNAVLLLVGIAAVAIVAIIAVSYLIFMKKP